MAKEFPSELYNKYSPREVDKKSEILIDPNDPTRGGKLCAAVSSAQ